MAKQQVVGSLDELQGICGFINQVKKSNWNRDNPRPKDRVGFERVYRQLLFYKEFYANQMPVIICEGKTDNVYLKCAVRSLAAKFPSLATKAHNRVTFNVRFKSYSPTTDRMLDLNGGIGDLKNFVSRYSGIWLKYSFGHLKQPVIIVIDNDGASKGMFSILTDLTGKKVNGSEAYIRAADNLYVVPIPKQGNQFTVIEDLFEKAVLNQKIDGKPFNPNKIYGDDFEYGKARFAERIVRPQQGAIDFTKFDPVLQAISDVIADYAAQP